MNFPVFVPSIYVSKVIRSYFAFTFPLSDLLLEKISSQVISFSDETRTFTLFFFVIALLTSLN